MASMMQNIDHLNNRQRMNRRKRALLTVIGCSVLLLLTVVGAQLLGASGLSTNLSHRNMVPSLSHIFGTDWLGRDMFTRTIKGLTLSVGVGMLASICSV